VYEMIDIIFADYSVTLYKLEEKWNEKIRSFKTIIGNS
jgi:hypothetical protein